MTLLTDTYGRPLVNQTYRDELSLPDSRDTLDD